MTRAPASHWDPQAYATNAGFVPALGQPVAALLAARAGERILDVGCGDGVLTAEIAATGASVVGVDASPEMIAAARGRGLDARVMSGEALDFAGEFDAAFSNAALHWIRDAGAVARGVMRALKPGARFVGEMGGTGNGATIWSGIHAERAARGYTVPASALFTEIAAHLIDRPTPLPGGVKGWIDTFMTGAFDAAGIAPAAQAEIAAAIEARVADRLRGPDGWVADYVRLRFTMRKPD